MTDPPRPMPADLVIDTSAIMALLRDEGTAARIGDVLRSSTGPVIAAPTRTELSIVAAARAADPRDGADAALSVLDAANAVTIPLNEQLADLAFEAWIRFGKGRRAARLNLGDVYSYALAAQWDLPLLCVGDDFAHTDLELVDVG